MKVPPPPPVSVAAEETKATEDEDGVPPLIPHEEDEDSNDEAEEDENDVEEHQEELPQPMRHKQNGKPLRPKYVNFCRFGSFYTSHAIGYPRGCRDLMILHFSHGEIFGQW